MSFSYFLFYCIIFFFLKIKLNYYAGQYLCVWGNKILPVTQAEWCRASLMSKIECDWVNFFLVVTTPWNPKKKSHQKIINKFPLSLRDARYAKTTTKQVPDYFCRMAISQFLNWNDETIIICIRKTKCQTADFEVSFISRDIKFYNLRLMKIELAHRLIGKTLKCEDY